MEETNQTVVTEETAATGQEAVKDAAPSLAETKVKEWSNPTAAGLVALAVACMAFFAMLGGHVGAGALPLIGCWLIGGFVVQVIVGVCDLKGGNHTGGNTFLFFSAFFMLVGGLEMFFKYKGIMSGNPLDGKLDGFVWCILTLVMWLWTPAFFKPKFSLLSIIVLLLDVALPFVVLRDFGVEPVVMGHIGGTFLLLTGLVGLYLSAAIVVNNAYGKKVLPLP